MDPREAFLEFLSSTEYADREDLFDMFSREANLHSTISLHIDHFKEVCLYIDQYIVKYMVDIPPHTGQWVPLGLLRYIHKDDRPYTQRLARFEAICQASNEHITLTRRQLKALDKGNLGCTFLSRMASFIFHVSEEAAEEKMELPHLHIGGVVREEKDVGVEPTNQKQEEKLLLLEYPQGLQGELHKAEMQGGGPSFEHNDDDESADPIPEVEINNLGTLIISGVEYVFLHDLEKALALRHDECLAMICTKCEFPLDNTDDHLADTLLPLGDSVQDTVAIVSEHTDQSEHAAVTEEEFIEVQALLLAGQTPIRANVTGEVDYPPVAEEEKSSVNLDATADPDNKQEVVGTSFTLLQILLYNTNCMFL